MLRAYCKTTVKPNFLLPMTLHIMQGLWVIAPQKELRFSVTCPEDKRSIFISRPPLDTIKLGMSYSATSDYLTLLPFYHNESGFAVSNPLGNHLTSSNSTRFQLWEPFLSKLPNFTKMELPPELKDVKEIPMRHLLLRLRHLCQISKERKCIWIYFLIAVIIIALCVASVAVVYCKYGKSAKGKFWLARKRGKTVKPSEYKTVPVKPESREDAVGEENLTQSAGIPPIVLSSAKEQLNHPQEP